jgi:hypothetical protein
MEYYAKGVDVNGNEINLTVDKEGNLYCSYTNLVSLESNAINVYCENNCLTELNLPEATTVYCHNNCLTELNLPKATIVDCEHNK